MPSPSDVGSLIILVSPFAAAGVGICMGRMTYRGELSRVLVSVFIGVATFSSARGALIELGKWLGSP